MTERIDIQNEKLAEQIRKQLHLEESEMTSLTVFTKEQLASVTNLEITRRVTDISWIAKYCPHLKQLVIKSTSAKDTYTEDDKADLRYWLYQVGITDFSFIKELKNLEILEIDNDCQLETLDLTGLHQLSSLTLKGNPKLKEVKGIEELSALSELTLVNNSAFHPTFAIEKMLQQGLTNLHLDFDCYPFLKRQYPNIHQMLLSATKDAGFVCDWQENMSDIDVTKLNTLQMEKMYQEAQQILDFTIEPHFSDLEKITAIYTYLVNYIQYDHEALKAATEGEKNDALKRAQQQHDRKVTTILNRRQSSYNAILEKKAVCEGYCNMFHYLLKAVGIHSQVVQCSQDLRKKVCGEDSDHGVVRIEINHDWFYFDPTYDAENVSGENFFRTKEEFSKNHVLSISEKEIVSPLEKPYSLDEMNAVCQKVAQEMNRKIEKRKAETKETNVDLGSTQTSSSSSTTSDFEEHFRKKYTGGEEDFAPQSDMDAMDEIFREQEERKHIEGDHRRKMF